METSGNALLLPEDRILPSGSSVTLLFVTVILTCFTAFRDLLLSDPEQPGTALRSSEMGIADKLK